MNQKKCQSCGHSWVNRVDKPKKCPNCYKIKYNSPGVSKSEGIENLHGAETIPETSHRDTDSQQGITSGKKSLKRNRHADTIYNRPIKIIKPNGI